MAEIDAEEPESGSRRLRKPTGLGPKGSKFWGQIADEYALEDTPEVALILEQACRTLDIVERLQRIVDEAPSLQVNGSRGQPAPLPELTEPPPPQRFITKPFLPAGCACVIQAAGGA